MTTVVAATTAPLPSGACDCHTHVIGPADRYPMVATRHYTPRLATTDELSAHLSRLGLERAVIVQPSVYGTDNRCLVDALTRLGARARGVAVLDPGARDDELDALHAVGVRGLRLNLESTGDRDADAAFTAAMRWAGRVERLGWHLQVFATLDTLAPLLERWTEPAVPLVLDHFAMVGPGVEPDDARARALLHALAVGRAWLKLSAAYRIVPGDPGPTWSSTADAVARRWAAVFREAAPQQLLWASDWPHTARTPGHAPHEVSAYRAVPSEALARTIAEWLPDAPTRRRVMVDNPARLYGF